MHLIPGFESRGKNMSADVLVRFVGGGLAGITAASLTYPLDLVRTRLAAQVLQILVCTFSHANDFFRVH